MSKTAIIAGNNIAALVAARELLDLGWQVQMITPSPQLGAHFAGVSYKGENFDVGVAYLEFTSFNTEKEPDVATYDSAQKNDSGRFVGLIQSYIADLGVDVVEVPTPQMWTDGKYCDDFIMTDCLRSLTQMAPELKERMRRELTEILASGKKSEYHAALKSRSALFHSIDFETVSLANHGKLFHERFVETLCRKIGGVPTSEVVALYHRVFWLPLIYPETLLSQFGPDPQVLPKKTFHYPRSGAMSSLVRALWQGLDGRDGFKLLQGKVAAIQSDAAVTRLRLDKAQEVIGEHLIWAADQKILLQACGAQCDKDFAKVDITVGFALLDSNKVQARFGTVLLPDGDGAAFRVTNQTESARRTDPVTKITVEFGPQCLGKAGVADELALKKLARESLLRLGVVASEEDVSDVWIKSFKQALPVPNQSNLSLYQHQDAEIWERLPHITKIGGLAGFSMVAINDQIVQGLKAARDLNGRR